MTRILLISGNPRGDSVHTAALRTAARYAPADLTATLYDGLRHLPAFIPSEPIAPDQVTTLRTRAAGADAVLFCTPEYAGSLPGSLKNLLDWLVDGGDLQGKPAAWLSVAAGGQDEGARTTLETVLAHAGARLLPQACVRLPVRPEDVDPRGVIADPRMHTAVLDILESLARSLTVPQPRPQPSWQAVSSVYPMVMRTRPQSTDPARRTSVWRGGS